MASHTYLTAVMRTPRAPVGSPSQFTFGLGSTPQITSVAVPANLAETPSVNWFLTLSCAVVTPSSYTNPDASAGTGQLFCRAPATHHRLPSYLQLGAQRFGDRHPYLTTVPVWPRTLLASDPPRTTNPDWSSPLETSAIAWHWPVSDSILRRRWLDHLPVWDPRLDRPVTALLIQWQPLLNLDVSPMLLPEFLQLTQRRHVRDYRGTREPQCPALQVQVCAEDLAMHSMVLGLAAPGNAHLLSVRQSEALQSWDVQLTGRVKQPILLRPHLGVAEHLRRLVGLMCAQ